MARQRLLGGMNNVPSSLFFLTALASATALLWSWRANHRIDKHEKAERIRRKREFEDDIDTIEEYANDPYDEGGWF